MPSSFDPAVHVPGLWRCARCSFVLVQSNLNATDGTVTARDNAGDRCPNDGAPLWRVTWKEHALDMAKRCEEAVDEAARAERSAVELIAAYYRRQIGRLMQQAEHWAKNGKPLAVHHRVRAADTYFQIVALMERDPALGWPHPFQSMRQELAMPDPYPPGPYPPTAEIHAYRDAAFVAAKVNGPAMVAVHIDERGDIAYRVTGGTGLRAFIVDERAPHDRVYELTDRCSVDEIQQLLGDDPVGHKGDDRHAAIENRITAYLEGRPHLRQVDDE